MNTNLKNKTNLICLGESELLQWTARKRILLLKDRVFQELPSDDDLSFFASSSFFKLDDAKARVIIQLKDNWMSNSLKSGLTSQKDFVEIHLDQIEEVAPVLEQYKRRLEDIDLPIADWSADDDWSLWLARQGAHERASAITESLLKLGFTTKEFLTDKANLEILTRNALRPRLNSLSQNHHVTAWSELLFQRDDLLKKMRFEGHGGRTSFLIASIKALVHTSLHDEIDKISSFENRETDWLFTDISLEISQCMRSLDSKLNSNKSAWIPTLVKAAYIRIFDELNYGQKNWNAIFNLIRYIKYSVDFASADYLIFLTLACLSTEEIYKIDIVKKFNAWPAETERLGPVSAL